MQETLTGQSKGTSKQLHTIPDTMRETAEQISSEIGDKTRRLAKDTSPPLGEFYDQASIWVQDNYGKTLSIIGVLGAVGMIGYMLGKNSNKSDVTVPIHHS